MGDDLVRDTIRLALLAYTSALTLRLGARAADWQQGGRRVRLARLFWSLACLAYLAHVAAAFHFVHRWSHDAVLEHTRQVGGIGEGIYVNHLFTLLWTADVIVWWLCPNWYAGRSPWVDRLLHGFMLFVIFNATVVFGSGLARWVGVLLFVWLGAFALRNRGSRG